MRFRHWIGGRQRLFRTSLIALMVVIASLAVESPAHAAATFDSWFVFDKNSSDPTNSTLHWYSYRSDLDPPRLVTHKTWRAGSGTGSTDDCYSSHGWLPNGWYSVRFDHDYDGTKIWGYVFALNNKVCSDGGTTRTELFIHSEMTRSGGQSCPSSGDDPQCWEGNGDFRSAGCIKLRPADVKDAASYFLAVNSENTTYSHKLQVVS